MSFEPLGLAKPIVDRIEKSGYKVPTLIQHKAIPMILAGHDVLAAAQTGTGKTAGFSLPIINQLLDSQRAKPNQARALILVPTRELAAQVAENLHQYTQGLKLSSYVVFGGVKINPQMQRLRRGVDILVATPGRLLDLMSQNAIKFPELEFLVLDEADRMLDMGFLPDIQKISGKLPKKRQTLLFSATFSQEIIALSQQFLKNPKSISVSPNNSTANSVKHWVYPVDKKRKPELLSYLIGHHRWEQVLIFVKTRKGANKVAYDLNKNGIQADAIHGDKSQGARTRVLNEFKNKKLNALVATDIAARGLDIEQLPQVINFDLPKVAEDYVHRIGRTGRAGMSGQAVSLVSADEVEYLQSIENKIQKKLKRKLVDGFEPNHSVPETTLSKKAKKKKPHKKKLAKQKERETSAKKTTKKKTSPRKSKSNPLKAKRFSDRKKSGKRVS